MISTVCLRLVTPVVALVATAVLASANPTQGWPRPDPAGLPEGPRKDEVLHGEALIRRTYWYIGPEVADPAKRFAGNNLACASCHLDGGRRRFGLPFIGVSQAYPADMARENALQTLAQRINGCMERSMNGRRLPEGSAELEAMIAYIDFLSDHAPTDLHGRGAPPLSYLDRAANPRRGAEVYKRYCEACHGRDGLGVRNGTIGDMAGYLYPPLWGPDGFNTGAGMHRLIKSARFIRANMPYGTNFDAPILSEEEAWDVAAYINIQKRPEKPGLDKDYPDRSRKPVDAPFGPYQDEFPPEQHKFGPFQPILDASQ